MSVATNYGSGLFPNGTDFPFSNPSSDVKGLLEDLHFSYDSLTEHSLPLKISSVTGFQLSSLATADLIISDSNGNEVFDTTTATNTEFRSWGTDRVIYVWETSNKYLMAVKYTGTGAVDKSPSFSPTNGVLDARTYEKESYKVNNVKLGNNSYQGNISLVAGYNIIFTLRNTTEVEGRRKVNNIQIGAVPGQGTGIYPFCPEDCITDAVKTINGLTASKSGNYSLVANECYWLSMPGESDGEKYQPYNNNLIKVRNNCLPCCECDDFLYVYRAIQNLYAKFKELGDRAMRVRTLHYANTERWLNGKTCRENAAAGIYALPYSGGSASMLVTFCNTSTNYVGPIRIDVNLEANGKTGKIQENTTVWYPSNRASPISIDPEGEWPNYVFRWDNIAPGRSAKVRFVVNVDGGNSSDYLLISSVAVLDDGSEEVLVAAEPYSVGLKD